MNLTEQDYIEIKVRMGNLINVFPSHHIRRKNMAGFNQSVDRVVKFIEDKVKNMNY